MLARLHTGLLARPVPPPFLLFCRARCYWVRGCFPIINVQTGFMPNLDEGGFVLDYLTAPGTSLTETEREMGEIETILRNDPAVASFLACAPGPVSAAISRNPTRAISSSG